jgi:CBS domain-containing protein
MQVNQAATMELEYVDGAVSIEQVAQQMKHADVGLVLVADGNRLLGVLTDRDIVTRAVAEKGTAGLKARDIMSAPVVCIGANEPLDAAAMLMGSKRVRRLVVLNDARQPVGVLSLDDIAFATRGDETAGQVLEELAHAPADGILSRGS